MKTKMLFIVMILICACRTLNGQKTITISDGSISKPKMEEADSIRDKDVKISKVDASMGNPYLVKMYRVDKGELKSYGFIVGTFDEYDKAIYTWVNDSTMTFKLINSGKKMSESFRMTASGDHSTMTRTSLQVVE